MIRSITIWLLIVGLATAAEPNTLPTPSDAVGWAIAHQIQLPESERPLYRYLWIPPYATTKDVTTGHVFAATSYAINECASQTGLVVQPKSIANGWMLAIYLPSYASSSKKSNADDSKTELEWLIKVWDGLAVDEPYFHLTDENSGVRAPVIAPHLKTDHARLLEGLNLSPASIYRVDWFLEQLTHLKYYEFMQFGFIQADNGKVFHLRSGKSVRTKQADIYKTIGVDEELAKRIDGDQRVALFDSLITGKPRRIDRIQGAAGRHNTGAVWQTWDLFDESVKVKQHPMYNLLEFFPDGGEIVFERQNGMHGYILINAQRELVVEAPPNLVSDHRIPAPPLGPGTRRLVSGISCIRCHAQWDGLPPAPNSVAKLLEAGTDIIDDLSRTDRTAADNVNRIAGLYAGDFSRRIKLGRDDYDIALRRSTKLPGLPEGIGAKQAGEIVSSVYERYAYHRVDAARACRDLGYNPGVDAVATLKSITPRSYGKGYTFENVVMASLRAGIAVRVRDWEQVFFAAMAEVSTRKQK